MPKSKVRFCWECGRKLWGNHYAVIKLDDGTERILHKSCAKNKKSEKVEIGPVSCPYCHALNRDGGRCWQCGKPLFD